MRAVAFWIVLLFGNLYFVALAMLSWLFCMREAFCPPMNDRVLYTILSVLTLVTLIAFAKKWKGGDHVS